MASILERNKNVKVQKKTREDYAEDALYREVWEEVNNEKSMRFVKKYYRHMVAAALAVMIVVVAVQIGIRMHRSAKIAAATNYETAILNTDANALAAIGKNGHGATADLALFQAYVIDGDVAKIEELAAHGNTRDFRDLARLHVIGRRGDEMSAHDVEKYLHDNATKSSPYYYVTCLTIAQKYVADGDRGAARKWLDKILNDDAAPASIVAAATELR